MRTSLRRAIALTGLTAAVVVSGSIAAADGTAVQDITGAALASAPVATELPLPTDPDVTAAAAPRAVTAPDRGDRTAAEPGWLGVASWYGPGFQGNLTANGEVYDQYEMTAAHKTLPFGTELRVTNTSTGRSVIVRINDRGPFIPGREIDLSRAAANAIGIHGVATVRLEEL